MTCERHRGDMLSSDSSVSKRHIRRSVANDRRRKTAATRRAACGARRAACARREGARRAVARARDEFDDVP